MIGFTPLLSAVVPIFAADATEPPGSVSLTSDPVEYFRQMTFLHPERLWFLLGLVAMLAAYVAMVFRRRRYAVRFTNVALLDKIIPEGPRWPKHLPPLLFLAGLGLGVAVFAEPQTVISVASERATVIMAIDTSLSMQAEDVIPSRIEGAKIAAQDFVDQLPPEINLGLISFNGIATIRIPPTQNRVAVKAAIADLKLGAATAIGEAIYASMQSIDDILPDESGATPPARVILMSDGKTTVGRPDAEAVEAARQAGIPISTIAFGTEGGTIILPETPNEVIPVPVDFDALALIADGTGGQFYTAASTAELQEVYADIGSSVGFEQETRPVTGPFIAAALLLLSIAWMSSLIWRVSLPA